MDPATAIGLVTACGSLAATCIKVVGTLHSLAETFKHAELSILALVEECATIQLAWKASEAWATRNAHHLDDHQEIFERLARSVYTGQLIISALEEDMAKTVSKPSAFRRRTSLSWNASVFQDHQNRIRGQVNALQLLLQVMSMPENKERVQVLTVREEVFRQVDDSVRSIIASSRSIQSSDASCDRSSTSSSSAKILRYTPFSFEDDLFTSSVYKRSYRPSRRFTNSISGLLGKERRHKEASRHEPIHDHNGDGSSRSAEVDKENGKELLDADHASIKDVTTAATDVEAENSTDDIVPLASASTANFTIHGSCPRCHHHHTHLRKTVLPAQIPEDPAVAPDMLCQTCSRKWANLGRWNATQLSLSSSPSTLATMPSTVTATPSSLLTSPSTSKSSRGKECPPISDALFFIGSTASAIASPSVAIMPQPQICTEIQAI